MAADGDVKQLVGALRALEDAIQHKGLTKRNVSNQPKVKAIRDDKVSLYQFITKGFHSISVCLMIKPL